MQSSIAEEKKDQRAFRVIVVGAGIAGLTLSNALQRAGIDHVVLEKHRNVVYPSGASIGIWPNGSRLLDQLGCLESIKKSCSEMEVSYNRDQKGKAFITSKLFDEIIKRHGYRFLLLERQEFIRSLYSGLPSREPIKTGCAVEKIEESESGVRVFLGDGSHLEGDMVVGCDGVASSVRQILWDNANKRVPNTITSKEMTSLKVDYKCLVGLSPAIPGFASGSMTVVHYDRFSFLLFTQPQLTFFFVFKKLDKTYRWPDLPSYTQKDIEAEAANLAALPINDELVFSDIWEQRLRGELINIEEGIFEHWHSGRIVLVGDAAHKFTPNIAFGGNSAMESVATLVNVLRTKLMSSPSGLFSHPSQPELSAVFQEYQKQRAPRAKRVSFLSTMITRVHACENRLLKFVATKCFPFVSDGMLGAIFSESITKGVKLDYVPLSAQPVGTDRWADEIRASRSRSKLSVFLVVVGVLAVLWTASRFQVS